MEFSRTLLKNIKKNRKAFLLTDLLVAIGIITILLSFSFRMTNLASRSTTIVRIETQANGLADEYVEMARSRRNEGWEMMTVEDDTGGFLEDGTEDPTYVPNPQPVVFGDNYYFSYHEPSGNLFLKKGEITTDEYGDVTTDGKFTRYIQVYEVRRNATTHLITTNVADPIDPKTLKFITRTEWQYNGKTRNVEKQFYLTDWYGF